MGKQAKIDHVAAAETMKNEIKATADAGINHTLNTLVTTFGERDADTEAAFLALLRSGDSPAAEAADEARIQGVLEALDGEKNIVSKIQAYSLLIPEYHRIKQQIDAAQHAQKQFEKSMKHHGLRIIQFGSHYVVVT